MRRRNFVGGLAAVWFSALVPELAKASNGQRLADAARAQVGVTTGYDPAYTRVSYPGGDVSRSTGVCADVIVRAGRDAFGLDLQRLVHEDMARDFAAYPSRKAWGERGPDANIDHRRGLNLETYWARTGARAWFAAGATPGDQFPAPVLVGDIVTWRLDARLPHVGVVVDAAPGRVAVVHNIGNGAEETALEAFQGHRAAGLFRWPRVG
jgi:uncharacterized protein YijF (DUF1287 family)